MVSFNHKNGSFEPFLIYNSSMSFFSPKSLKILIFRHEIAILFLVAVMGLIGGISAFFWQQNSAESVRINSMFYLTEQIRGELYAQIQEMIRARVLEDTNALKAYPEYSRSISERFNQLRRRSDSHEEDMAIQELNLSYREIQVDMNNIFSNPYIADRLARIQILNPTFSQQMVGKFENRYHSFKSLLRKKHQALDSTLEIWTKFAPFVIPIPLIIAFVIVFYTRRIMRIKFIQPIANIMRGASKISSGRLDYKIKEEGVEEVSELAISINDMAKELSDNRDTLLENERQVALGSLIPVVAHNVRNPLASIRATAQLLEDAENRDDITESKNAIIDTIDRLGRWVSSLVSYLHPLEPNLKQVSAPELLDAALNVLNAKIKEKNIQIIKKGWEELTLLSVDPDLMEQALYSLLANSVEASPKSTNLEISVLNLKETIEIHIVDNGPGLPFEPKPGNLEPGPSTKRFGTGLGIPIAFKICQKHNWTLKFDVMKEKGTKVIIIAPLKEKKEH